MHGKVGFVLFSGWLFEYERTLFMPYVAFLEIPNIIQGPILSRSSTDLHIRSPPSLSDDSEALGGGRAQIETNISPTGVFLHDGGR